MKFNPRYIIAAVSILVIGSVLYFFREIVSYVILAWVISMIGAPLVVFLRKYMGKNMAAGITLSLFIVLFGLLLYAFIPPLVTQVKNLSNIDYEEAFHSLEQPISDWENWLIDKKMIMPRAEDGSNGNGNGEPDRPYFEDSISIDSLFNPRDSSYAHQVTLNIKIDASALQKKEEAEADEEHPIDFFGKLKSNVGYYMNPQRIQEIFSSTVNAFGNIIIGIASVIFIAFFFLREQGLFYDMVKAAVPTGFEGQSEIAIDQTSRLLIRYFSGILLQMTIITLFVFIALSIIGVKNALLIGFFAAVMNVIPYIGPIIGATFAVIIVISSNLGGDFYTVVSPQLLKVIIVFALMQALDNFVLQPTIFSKSVKAHPLEIFLVVLIGAKLGGVLGMVLAIPAYTALRVVAKVFLSEFKVVQRLTKNI